MSLPIAEVVLKHMVMLSEHEKNNRGGAKTQDTILTGGSVPAPAPIIKNQCQWDHLIPI